jgi:Tol biopolymer transport system component
MALSGCGSSGSPRPASLNTAAAGGIPGKPPKPPDEPEPPPDPAIAFTVAPTTGGRELWVMNADGTNRTKLVGGGNLGATSPSWSPEGDFIAFLQTSSSAPDGRGLYKVSVAVAEGAVVPGDPQLLLPVPEGSSWPAPAWSPLGDCIAYVWLDPAESDWHDEIRAISPDGQPLEPLYKFCDAAYPIYPIEDISGGVSWSADAKRLALVVMDYSVNVNEQFLAVVDLETATATLEDVTRPAFDVVFSASTDWARTSDRIVFDGRMAGQDRAALWVVDLRAPGDPEQRFTKLMDGVSYPQPSWSPDDTRLVFVKRKAAGELWILDVATGAQTLLAKKEKGQKSLDMPDWRRF